MSWHPQRTVNAAYGRPHKEEETPSLWTLFSGDAMTSSKAPLFCRSCLPSLGVLRVGLLVKARWSARGRTAREAGNIDKREGLVDVMASPENSEGGLRPPAQRGGPPL